MPLSDGLRITFGADRADMNAASEGALRKLARDQPPSETVTYTVTAFATPQPDDPSTPRRLALSRALAVRSILIAQGVPSPRIIVKVAPIGAVLASAGKAPPVDPAPPDRVDITRTFQADPPTGPAGPASTTPAGGAKR
jgi:outer membrane protein OmpA-like peptidoglycan-associated protein